MPSAYLQSADLATYGAANATATQILQASAQIDTYLGRKEGLVWEPDSNGNPCYMAAPPATLSLTANGSIAPGANVTVVVSGPTGMLQVGDALIADSANSQLTEALTVQSVSGQNVTFASVQNAHSSGCSLDAGRVIVEQRTMPENRPITTVSKTPVMRVISGVGRYGYMRRSQDAVGSIDIYNLLAVMSKFGGPPAWEIWTPQANSIDPQTGMIWVPAGVLLAYYTEVRIQYVAGWTYSSLPAEIKQSCANIINNIQNTSGLIGSAQKMQAGDTSIQRFQNQPGVLNSLLIDDDTKSLLQPFMANVLA